MNDGQSSTSWVQDLMKGLAGPALRGVMPGRSGIAVGAPRKFSLTNPQHPAGEDRFSGSCRKVQAPQGWLSELRFVGAGGERSIPCSNISSGPNRTTSEINFLRAIPSEPWRGEIHKYIPGILDIGNWPQTQQLDWFLKFAKGCVHNRKTLIHMQKSKK